MKNIGTLQLDLKMINILLLLFLTAGIIFPQSPENEPDKNYKIVVPGPEYEAGSTYRFFFGDHWRDLWTTPIKIKILNLGTFAGGLTPKEVGGGQQTTSLKFDGADGNEYKFRSINKDLDELIPDDLEETFIANIMEDQISAHHPSAALITIPFHNALGIMDAEPSLYVMPDDERLGEYRDQFKGMIGTIEVHPNEKEDDKKGFAGSKKIVGSYELFEKMEEDNKNVVNTKEYLTARILDIFLGDWDRHVDQWRWARFERGDIDWWEPIPRDRDQAFSRYNGLFPKIFSAFSKFKDFTEEYTDVKRLIFSARYLDKRFLTGLTKAEWDSVTNFVQNRLTDSVIVRAVKKMPEEMFEKEGENLIRILKGRRDNLKTAVQEFYDLVFNFVNIRGSSKDEFAEIERIDEENVRVSLFRKKENDIEPEPFFNRVFNANETEEIRIFMHGGSDSVVVSGIVGNSIPVHISADSGSNVIVDSSDVKASILGVFASHETMTFAYYCNDSTEVIEGHGTAVYKRIDLKPKNEVEKYETPPDFGSKIGIKPWIKIGSEEGLLIGGGPYYESYAFNKYPYSYRGELLAAYATKLDDKKFQFNNEFISVFRGVNYHMNLAVSGLEVSNFYGYGNETQEVKELEENDFYELEQQQFIFNPFFEIPLSEKAKINIGTTIKYVEAHPDISNLISQLKPFGYEKSLLNNFYTELELDYRVSKSIPDSGYMFKFGAYYYPKYNDKLTSFGKVTGQINFHYPFRLFSRSSIALRLGGEKIWGQFPYFESAFIGGSKTLRGFDRERFAGNASVYSSAELRLFVSKVKIFIPVYWGIMTFADAGRVFVSGEESDLWHNSYGGGLLISLVNRLVNFSVYAAKSKEDLKFYLTTGYSF